MFFSASLSFLVSSGFVDLTPPLKRLDSLEHYYA